MERTFSDDPKKQIKAKSIPSFHVKTPSVHLEEIKVKISTLEKKYSQFIISCLSTFQTPGLENNKHIIESPMKKNSKDQSCSEESQNFSQIVDNFVSISKMIPEIYEDQFTDFKAETLKYIFRLQNKVPKAFQSASPENKKLSKRLEFKASTGAVRLKDSNRETEETSQLLYTGELSRSRESNKNVNKQLGIVTKNIPRLKLNRIDEFSPINSNKNRTCTSSSRIDKKKILFNTLRDSINPENENTEIKFKQTLKLTRHFIKSIQNLCENYPDPEEKVGLIINKCQDFSATLENIQNEEVFITSDESKLREDLENCKKIALMYEKRLKMKNETILVLRRKEKEWVEQEKKSKKFLVLFDNETKKFENFLIENVSEKIENINSQFTEIEQKIKKNLIMGLEEIKKAVEMTSKNDFFDQQTEVYQKNIEDLELVNRNLFAKNKVLEGDLSEYRNKCSELENMVRTLKKSQDEQFLALSELESAAMLTENLRKSLKIKEFELKQKEFEKSELDADKNELLSRIESLEIEKIESHECINSITIKYNQEIENFVYNNTVQRNQIQALEKQKEENIKHLKEFEVKLEAANKEILSLKDMEIKYKDTTNQAKNIIEELKKLKQEKLEHETKLAGFQELLDSKAKLEQELENLKQSIKPITIIENIEVADPDPKETKNSTINPKEDEDSLQSAVLEIESLKSSISVLKNQKRDLKNIITHLNSELSQLSEQKQVLESSNEHFQNSHEKLESINKYLLEDLKHRHQSYNEIIQDLKLDIYQYEKSLKSYECQIESLQLTCDALQSTIDSITPIPETLNEALSASLSRNQIDTSIKDSYLSKIEQLEEDLKNLTTKLLKKNNENSILEDCLMVYSPRGNNINTSQEEVVIIKCELIEAHKSLEESKNEKKTLQLALTNNLNLLEEHKKSLEKNQQVLNKTEKKLREKNEENGRLKKNCEELKGECEKLGKIVSEIKSSMKNSEMTYSKNLSYLEEQVKKHKKLENDCSGSFVLSPRYGGSELRVPKENSFIGSDLKQVYEEDPPLDPASKELD